MTDDNYLDCVYNLWTGFVGKATCKAGFLVCKDLSCPAYTPKPKPKHLTNHDRLISKTPEELAEWLLKETYFCCNPKKDCGDEPCMPCVLSWLKSPVEVENG